jgi:radical SAM protein with 4Fe4S-binding SPASM domain
VTTNGLLLDEEKIKFLTGNFNLVGVSIDNLDPGYAYRNVKSIKEKLPLLLKYQGQDKILIKMTIMPEFADSFFNSYEMLIRLGFRHINISPILGYFWSSQQSAQFLANIKKIIKKSKALQKFGYHLHLKMVEDIKYIINNNKEHCPVLREELAIDTNGDIYPCQFFVALPEEYRKKYILGNINLSEVNSDLVKKVEDFKICDNDLLGAQIAKCRTCRPDRSCKKICYAFNLQENKFDSQILANAWQLENDFIDVVKRYYFP